MTAEGPDVRASSVIEDFFGRGFPVGLYLPDGWYGGRPMDNQHELTLALDRPARLLVELDEHVLLTFTGESMTVERTTTHVLDGAGTPAVRVAGFAQLVVDARRYGSSKVRATIYTDGEVVFVSGRSSWRRCSASQNRVD